MGDILNQDKDSSDDDIRENYRVGTNFRWLASSVKEPEELCFIECGIEKCTPDKFYGPTIRESYYVHFILQGKGYLKINNQTFMLQRGQIFTTPPGIEVYYYAEPSNPWHYTWVSFSGTKAKFFLEKAGITDDQPVRECFVNPEAFLTLTEKLLNHYQLTITNELIHTSLLYEIIALLISSYTNQYKTEERYDHPPYIYLNAALEYIHRDFGHIHVSDIAGHIGISQAYLSRIFKEKMDISIKDYIFNYRMTEAGRLLRTTMLSIQEIAKQVGYTNPFSFSQSFKKAFGTSPRYYRERLFVDPNPEDNEDTANDI